mmetsp:Transcript_16741/g.38355  ORF Transcript_16741/g.38355 Transcript_16741/m.38355 type:complete len:201 (-) Transcript_16741:84-686(-)
MRWVAWEIVEQEAILVDAPLTKPAAGGVVAVGLAVGHRAQEPRRGGLAGEWTDSSPVRRLCSVVRVHCVLRAAAAVIGDAVYADRTCDATPLGPHRGEQGMRARHPDRSARRARVGRLHVARLQACHLLHVDAAPAVVHAVDGHRRAPDGDHFLLVRAALARGAPLRARGKVRCERRRLRRRQCWRQMRRQWRRWWSWRR